MNTVYHKEVMQVHVVYYFSTHLHKCVLKYKQELNWISFDLAAVLLQCSDFRRPRDVSADWITGNIYWTDHSRMHWFSYYTAHWTKLRYSINVGQLKGPNCTRLITDIAGEPYAIVANSARGWVCPLCSLLTHIHLYFPAGLKIQAL